MLGGTAPGKIMSVLVIISGIGALIGWTMICAEMPLAAAKDGLFPERFTRMNKAGVPVFGIIASTVLASIAMIVNYLGTGGANAFTTLVLMTGITAAIPYGFSALAQIKWRRADRKTLRTPRFLRDMIVAILALVFSVLFIVYSRNTGQSFLVVWAPFLLAAAAFALGIPVYNRQRGKMTEPTPVPPYPTDQSGTDAGASPS
jgi:APA family basic amino acid/polyamine antiporter